MKDQILSTYDTNRVIYLEYEKKIKELINALIKRKDIVIHTIESRVKDRESLSKKIDKKQDKYTSLDEITDTVGLRIITYFEDDVDLVADLLKSEFQLDEYNSVDKRNKTNPVAFGYASLHYVLKLKEPRASLPEYNSFKGINFEIQIRSILQHAWAEIEHDIGYKSEIEVPIDIRRNFSRVASLLELADIEFIRIKEEIEKYSNKVKENIKHEKLNIPIDKVTLKEFVQNSKIVQELDLYLLSLLNGRELKFDDSSLERNLIRLEFFNVDSIDKLKRSLETNKTKIEEFAKKWLEGKEKKRENVSKGISIFYLGYVLAGQTQDKNKVLKYAEFSGFENCQSLSNRIINIYKGL